MLRKRRGARTISERQTVQSHIAAHRRERCSDASLPGSGSLILEPIGVSCLSARSAPRRPRASAASAASSSLCQP